MFYYTVTLFKMIIYKTLNFLYEFVPDKKVWTVNFCKTTSIYSETSDSIFDYTEIWFSDQNNNSLQIEDKVSVTLIIQNNRL